MLKAPKQNEVPRIEVLAPVIILIGLCLMFLPTLGYMFYVELTGSVNTRELITVCGTSVFVGLGMIIGTVLYYKNEVTTYEK